MKNKLKNYFLTGVVSLVPVVITGFLVYFIVSKIGGVWYTLFKNVPYVNTLPTIVIDIIGVVISFILILFAGYFVSNIIGRYIYNLGERILHRTPLIKSIYSSAKELTNTLFMNKSSFSRVVFVEFLHEGQYTLAFVTSDTWSINDEESVTLFMPTSPNPTSGFFIVVPKNKVIETDITVEEALKLLVSSGMVFSRKGIIKDEHKR